MTPHPAPSGSIDVKIGEIPNGVHRLRIIGTIVSLTSSALILNDGENLVKVGIGQVSIEKLEVGETIRAIMTVTKNEDVILGELIAWNRIKPDQVQKYWRLVKIERRIPKE